jgi:hypothetical protein
MRMVCRSLSGRLLMKPSAPRRRIADCSMGEAVDDLESIG